MSKVYNTNGSLNRIKRHLLQNNIQGFHSIPELQRFQTHYNSTRHQIVSNCRMLLTDERNKLNAEVLALEREIASDRKALQQKFDAEVETLGKRYDEFADAEKTVIQEFTYSFKALFILIRINYIESFASAIISRTSRRKIAMLDVKRGQFEYLVSHFDERLTAKVNSEVHELDRAKKVIDEINTYIYGAIGEDKVARELERLPDVYTVINDFCYTFDSSLFYKEQKTYINHIQIDHLVISSAGVFLIETKNWSKESVQNENLRSPVDQIKRSSYSLYEILKRSSKSALKRHH